MARLALCLIVLVPALAFAQDCPPPAPPPVYVPAPVPPVYYVPPPAPPPPPGPYYARRHRYRAAPPWIRPPLVRGTFGFSGFGTIVAGQPAGHYLTHGGGFSVYGGVEIGRVVGIEAKYTNSFHNPADDCGGGNGYIWCTTSYLSIESISLNLKIHIPTNTRFVPYVNVAPVAAWLGRRGYYTDSVGGGFEAGGGFDVWFSRHGTVGVEALYRGLAMTDYATYADTKYLSLVQIGGTIAAHF